MAKVTIHVSGTPPIEVEASPNDEKFYNELPFTASNVMCTEIRD